MGLHAVAADDVDTDRVRKRDHRPPDIAAAVYVAAGHTVDEDRPSKLFLGCENVSYSLLINSTKRVSV